MVGESGPLIKLVLSSLRTVAKLFLSQRPDQPARIKADCGSNVEEFQHIEPAIPALIFRDIGRRLAEPICDHRLRKAGCFASCL
jgi:hypothetical protein